jgi:uncharacterized protein (TIGR03083 family)
LKKHGRNAGQTGWFYLINGYKEYVMVPIRSSIENRPAEAIPFVTADEAYSLLKVQLDRLITLLETLEPQDWTLPTACTAWNVRDIVAHQAGGYASGTSYRELIRQYSSIPKKGQLPEDAVNELQLNERANRTPAELIAELRTVGPIAIEKWAHQFKLAKLISIPHPVPGILSLRHLMWVIHSRDTWMHRLDICRAAGRDFEQTADQDGRIVALVMLDVMKRLHHKLGNPSVTIELTGISGGIWNIGPTQPSAAIRMDALTFNIYASGRFNLAEVLSQATLSGDTVLAERVLKNIMVLY